jgi:hypothetical protein
VRFGDSPARWELKDAPRTMIGWRSRLFRRLQGRAILERLSQPSALLLMGIIVAGFAARVWMLGQIPAALWWDEITGHYIPFLVLHNITQPSTWALIHSTPPTRATLYYYLTYSTVQGTIWSGFFQTSNPVAIRIMAAVYGTAALYVIYKLGTELFDRRTGTIAAGLGVLTPWLFYFSRYIVPPTSLEFWPLAAVYLGLTGARRNSSSRLSLSVVAGGFVAYTHLSGIVVVVLLLVPLWIVWAAQVLSPLGTRILVRRPLWFAWRALPFVVVLALVLFPLFYFQLQPTSGVFGGSFYVWQQYGWNLKGLGAFFTNVWWSWSPDFLAISGGLQGAQVSGFMPHISVGGAWQYGAGYTGMLTQLGWLVYVGIGLVVVQFFRSPNRRDAGLVTILLVLTYTLVGGVVWFDNPNAGRLAFAAGFFVILIAYSLVWIIDSAWRLAWSRGVAYELDSRPRDSARRRPSRSPILVTTVCATILIASACVPYGVSYFTDFPAASGVYFAANVTEVAGILTSQGLWNHEIVVEAPIDLVYLLPGELAFFDTHQPPQHPILAFNGSTSQVVPLVSSAPGFIFVSMTGTPPDTLLALGIPFAELVNGGNVTVYQVFGNQSPSIKLSSVEGWTERPEQQLTSTELNATISYSGPSEHVSIQRTAGTLIVNASIPANATSGDFWQVDLMLPVLLQMNEYSLVNLSWNESSSGKVGGPNMIPLIQNQTGLFPGTAHLVYPGTLVNILPPQGNLSFDALAGFRLLGSLNPGSTQSVVVLGSRVYSVTPLVASGCETPLEHLRGSQFDVAYPTTQGLDFNAYKSTLSVDLCSVVMLPTNVSAVYMEVSYSIVSPFPTPSALSVSSSNFSTNVSGPGGPPDSSVNLFLSIPPSDVGMNSTLELKLSFIGKMVLSGVDVVGFYFG